MLVNLRDILPGGKKSGHASDSDILSNGHGLTKIN